MRHRTTRHEDFQPWETHAVAKFLPDKEDNNDEDYHVVTEKADVAMEEAAPPPGAGICPQSTRRS
jgi:hypothetical protein